MRDRDCVSFLQWALPQMGFRWPGFRKVRQQVCKRIGRRLRELGLEDLGAYRDLLLEHPEEWSKLDDLCRITISRFCRDQGVFRAIETDVLPRLADQPRGAESRPLRIWSAGCGAGEEPYSLAILVREQPEAGPSPVRLRITATDADRNQLDRAQSALYPPSSLRELSPVLRQKAFEPVEPSLFRLRETYLEGVEFLQQDLRRVMPPGPFDLILCRNLVFTYYDPKLQQMILDRIIRRLAPGGFLVIGSHESLPKPIETLPALAGSPCILGPFTVTRR